MKDRDAKQQVTSRAKEMMASMPNDDDAPAFSSGDARPLTANVGLDTANSTTPSPTDLSPVARNMHSLSAVPSTAEAPVCVTSPVPSAFSGPLKEVLDLHTSKRMKTPEISDKNNGKGQVKVKQGVSIPSQRRYLYYWSLLLSHLAPQTLWTLSPQRIPSAQVRLTQIKIRMRDIKGIRKGVLTAANFVLGKSGLGRASEKDSDTQVWVSLARYDDEYIKRLETCERETRSEDGHMGKRKGALDLNGVESLMDNVQWDKDKMVRSFARLGEVGVAKSTNDPMSTKVDH